MYIAVRQGAILTEHGFFTDDIFNGDLGEFAKVGDILAFKQVVTSTNDTMIVEGSRQTRYSFCEQRWVYLNTCGYHPQPMPTVYDD